MSWENATVRPITLWPGEPTRFRSRSAFQRRAGVPTEFSKTIMLLDRELGMLGARRLVVEMAVTEQDIRRDGRGILASARPAHPGVILSFESRHGPLRYSCDKFDRWQDNVRAIALSLEALRKVDRYGITKRGEQYTGWKALPSGIEMPAATKFSSVEDAARWMLARHADEWPQEWLDSPNLWTVDELIRNADSFTSVYRDLAKRLHPDQGGDADEFKRLQEARSLIGTVA